MNEWISVKDRLPEPAEPVLTYGAKGNEWAVMIRTRGGNWEVETTHGFHSAYPPTHWQPLPPAPAKEPT